jgi:enamine deaminase RidA (YjgF/YER057c/UK114 family)
MALEIESIDGLVGTPISYAYEVKAGPWVFLTGQEAFDWRTGTIDASVRGLAGFPAHGTRHPSRREADFVLPRMTGVLREYGTDLSHAMRLDQYYRNPRAMAAYHLPRHDNFRDYIPPSTTAVMQRLFSASSTVSTSLIAVMPEPGREFRKVPHFSVGEFLLPSGLMAVGNDGRIIGGDVSPSSVSLAHAGYIQAAALYDYAETLRHAAGTAMDRLLRAQYFVAEVVAFAGIAMAWASRYGTQPHPFLCVQTPSPMLAPGCALIGLLDFDCDAVTGGGKKCRDAQETKPAPSSEWPPA